MGVVRKKKAKFNPRPKIDYPPVPTRKWVPPDKRPKPPKPEPKYVKPEGISQKLAISSLKKVWHNFLVYKDFSLLTGTFSQTHKRFSFKTNGYQGVCNCAMACAFAHLYSMAILTYHHLNQILEMGDLLYQKSINQGDRCLIEVNPLQVFTSFYLGNNKISLAIEEGTKTVGRLWSVTEQKAKDTFIETIQEFFKKRPSGIFTMQGKNLAIWIQDGAYYLFDPTEHDQDAQKWFGIPGGGVCVLFRCPDIKSMVDQLYENVDAKTPNVTFEIIGCIIQRMVYVNTTPPETFEDIAPVLEERPEMEDEEPPRKEHESLYNEAAVSSVAANRASLADVDRQHVRMEEVFPEFTDEFPPSKRPSWMGDGNLDKADICVFPIPTKPHFEAPSYYIELVPDQISILRASTCQTDPQFTKYEGRQSFGNALSALIMLRFSKSGVWVPRILNTILKYGDLLYRDAMVSIPRTQSLKLSNFPKKVEYEAKLFNPVVEENKLIGRLNSQDFDVLDLLPALDEFLTDHDNCIIRGPLTLAVWIEDNIYYMFDPDERDEKGQAIIKVKYVGANLVNLDYNPGVACVTKFTNLKDLADLYMNNTEKAKRNDPFYLNVVQVNDYVEIPESWYAFLGLCPGKWILRGNYSQASDRFSPDSKDTQGTANALIALMMQTKIPVKDWASETLDQILTYGDEFYLQTIESLTEKGKYTDKHLLLSEMNKSFLFENLRADFEIEDCLFNGIINAKSENDLPSLKKGLEQFFVDYDTGVITTRNISIAIWKKDDIFYCFDPHTRDDKGIISNFGTSCALRTLDVDEMAKSIEMNLDPSTEDFYNINKVVVRIFEAGDAGIRPALGFYTKINDDKAILRSIFSEISNKYGINVGKQSVPMCVTAVAYNRLKPSIEWDKHDIDDVLNKGDDLYVKTMERIYKEQREIYVPTQIPIAGENQGDKPPQTAPSGPQAAASAPKQASEPLQDYDEENQDSKPKVYDLVSSDQVNRSFNVGPNTITFEIEDFQEGTVKDELKDALKSFYEQEQTDDYFNQEVLLESELYTVVVWRDDKVFFLFDSKPRDKNGNVIGQEDWLPEPPPPKPKKEKRQIPTDPGAMGDHERGEEDEEEEEVIHPEGEEPTKREAKEFVPAKIEEQEEEGKSDEEGIKYPPWIPKGSDFWLERQKEGKACILWFTSLDDLINHIYDNYPPLKRADCTFKLRPIKLINEVQLKTKYNPEDERLDVYSGSYYDFKELEHGMWILRGTRNLYDLLYPEDNRGKQQLPTAIAALATAYAFGMTCFNSDSVDTILSYGDRYHTFLKRIRKTQILGDKSLGLKDDEVEWLLKHEEFDIEDIVPRLCLSKFLINLTISPNVIEGDIKAQDFEEILDVKRGLQNFFEAQKYGVMTSKTLTVAVWKGERIYYMFDGLSRGPNGINTANGTACVTRYLDTERMAEVFLENLPKYGRNAFYIHSVMMRADLCPREREPKPPIEVPKKITKTGGFRNVIPGKFIIRGTMSQNDPKFGKEPDTMSAPIAIIALTMSLIHKPSIWSRPIVDDILYLGSELYDETIDTLGFEFNAWEENLDIWRVNNDYKIGVIKANCELRNMDQRGIIDIKDEEILNLRRGIENFFEENTHGILVTEPLTLALWEEEQDNNETLIYMYDPYPRGPSGMPVFDGTACVVTFVNAKMASDHIIGCILDEDKKMGEFRIVPVEIVVGNVRTKRKLKKAVSEVGVLPRCSKLHASEIKKKLRKIAEEQRKRKAAKKLQLIGRCGYHTMKGGEAIIRGCKSQNSDIYSEQSRNNQDIPNCIVSVVVDTFMTVDIWNHKHVDLILDTGNQLYVDSYIVYGPKDKKLGMENVLRKFYMHQFEVHVTIYKPIISDVFNVDNVNKILNSFFQQETICLLSYETQWVSIFFKGGYFYVFDPHERDTEGNKMKKDCKEQGVACVLRFENINVLSLKLVANLAETSGSTEENQPEFTLWMLSVVIKSNS